MSKRALVVDDDFFFVEFLGELLEKRGYEVIKAHSSKEGLTKLEEGPFDILFSDLIMPKIDGTQFINIARSKSRDHRLHIIGVSGSLIEQMDQLPDANVDYFLAKGPIEAMEDRINNLLDQMEDKTFSPRDEDKFLVPGTLYPRQVTSNLVDMLNFHKGIIESIGFGILVVDRDARVINVTSTALDLLNLSPVDVLNQHVTSLFPGQERPFLVEALKGVAQDKSLKKMRLDLHLDAKTLQLTISLLRVGRDIAGWIIAIDDLDE